MILLLGASSYIGQAFARALRRRKDLFIPLARDAFDFTRFEFLFDYVRKIKPDLVINAAEHGEPQGGDAGEVDRMEMLQTNTLLPQTIARVCFATNTPLGHVSSGSIYSGAKVVDNGNFRVERDLGRPAAHALFASHPEKFCGFNELDEPNFSFKSCPCTFYSGTKALAEEALQSSNNYIWRLRLPFNHEDGPNNFLSLLQHGGLFNDAINSIAHLDECVSACLQLWDRRAPVGIYNIVNPGPVRTHEVVQMIQQLLKRPRRLELLLYQNDEHATRGDRIPRSDCILDSTKLLSTGIRLRTARQALEMSLESWEPKGYSMMRSIS